jgi:hypothetical protein
MNEPDNQSQHRQEPYDKEEEGHEPESERTAPLPSQEQQEQPSEPEKQRTSSAEGKTDWRDKRKQQRPGPRSSLVLSDDQELVFSEEEENPNVVNPDWRDKRKTSRTGGGRGGKQNKSLLALLTSPQELQMWLQEGGWRFVAGAALLVVVVLVILLSLNRSSEEQAIRRDPATGDPIVVPPATLSPVLPDAEPETAGTPPQPQDSAPPTAVPGGNESGIETGPEPTTPPTQPAGDMFVVVNTGTQGLRVRADHSTSGQILATIPEGTRVEQIGEDFTGANFVWRNVRTPAGVEGWVAVDWLQPANP